MRDGRRIRTLAVASALFLGLTTAINGCTKSAKTSRSRPRFAFVVNVPTDRFWDIAYAGCLQAASEEDVTVEFYSPNEVTAQQQKQIVEALMSRGIDGMAISPLNPESLALILKQASEMFPVICQDSDAANSGRACYIGTDNVALGHKLGELMKQALPAGGKVALLVGQLDVANAQDRQKGALDALAGSNIDVIGTFTDGAQPAEAKRVATDILAKSPDLKGVIGLWGYNAPQAVNALEEMPGRDVKVVGSDESIDTMRAIKSGKEFASVAQKPFEFGYQSIKTLAALHRGNSANISLNETINVETYVITRDNLGEVEEQIKSKLSLLEKFRAFGG